MNSALYHLVAHPCIWASHVLPNLKTVEIVRLDSALLNRRFRSDLLHSYRTAKPVKLPYAESTTEIRSRLKWLLSRRFCLDRPGISIEHLKSKELQRHLVENVHALIGGISTSRLISLKTFADPNFLHPVLVSCIDDVSVYLMDGHLPANFSTSSLCLPFTNLTSFEWNAGLSNMQCLVRVLQDNPRLKVFRVRHRGSLPKGLFHALSLRGTTLTTLQLVVDNFTDDDFREISQRCTILRELDLTNSSWVETNMGVTDAGVAALVEGCPLLEQVKIEGKSLTGAALTALFTHCVRLKHVTCPNAIVNTAAVLALSDPARMACIEELSCSWGVKGPLDADCYALAFSGLKRLRINDIASKSVDTLCTALRAMPQLQSICFATERNRSLLVPVRVLDAVAASCTHRLHVTARVVGDAERSMVVIAQRNPGLTHVELKDVPVGITDAVLHALAEHCTGLRAVELSCANLVTDASVVALVRACPRLFALTLLGCARLTDASIHAIADRCRELDRLDIRDSTLVGATALELLLRMCTKLYRLEISGASITEAAVQRLQGRNGKGFVMITRTPVSFRTWVAAKAASVARVLSRSRSAASVAPAEGLDNVCV